MNKDFTALFSDLNETITSYSKIFFVDIRNLLLSKASDFIRSILLTIISYFLIIVSSIYLLICGINSIANYFNLSDFNFYLIYALTALVIGVSYQIYYNYKHSLQTTDRNNDLKVIANFRQNLSNFNKQTSLLPSITNYKLIKKYKSLIVLVAMVTIIYVIKSLFSKTNDTIKDLRNNTFSLKIDSIWDSVKVLLFAVTTAVVKQLVDEFLINLKKPATKID